jgi:hypothetical protein
MSAPEGSAQVLLDSARNDRRESRGGMIQFRLPTAVDPLGPLLHATDCGIKAKEVQVLPYWVAGIQSVRPGVERRLTAAGRGNCLGC